MCISPLRIKNPSLRYNLSTDRAFLYVPCGHCSECLNAKRADWQARGIAEYMYTSANGGCTYSYVLTYSPENITMLNGELVFNKRDVQLFLKRLRKQLSKINVTVKYLVTSEYGGNTHRPHYHVLFHFSHRLLGSRVRQLVEQCWQLGFVSPLKNGGLINSTAGVMYVCKYITKDYDFNDKLLDKHCSKHFNIYKPL